MASKKFDTQDEFGLDHELDMPNFGFEQPSAKDLSTKHVALGLGKSALKGGLEGISEGSFISRTIRTALPKGYGTAFDIADESRTTLRSLYNDSGKELKPLINDLKRATRRIEEPITKYLPSSLSKRLNAWATSDQGTSAQGLDAEEQRTATINASLGEVFQHQVQTQAKRDQAEDARGRIREGIDQTRHKDSMGQLNEIRLSVSQLAAYQNNITASYQRKSLELQYRTYFATRDMFEEQKRMNAVSLEAYQKLIVNTGKPEYEKLTERDRIKQVLRNKFADTIEGTLLGDRGDFMRKIGANIHSTVMGRVQHFASGMSMGLQTAEMANDAMQMQREMSSFDGSAPQSNGQIASGMIGNMAAQHYASKLVDAAKKKIPTTGRIGKIAGQVQKGGNIVSYYGRSLPQRAKGWADGFEGIPFVPNWMSGILRDAIQMGTGPDRTVQKDSLKDMQGPAVFTNQVRKSITEVIPGYLARIFREIQVLRTGNEKIDLLGYDFMTNKFDTHRNTRRNVYNALINKDRGTWMHQDLNNLAEHIDPKDENGNSKFTPEQREALKKQLLTDNIRGVSGSTEYYSNPMVYQGDAGKHNQVFAKHFEDRFSNIKDPKWEARNTFAGQHTRVGGGVQLQMRHIQDMANSGLLPMLEDMELVDKHGVVNTEKIAAYHLNPDQYTESTLPDGVEAMRTEARRASRKRGGSPQAEPPSRRRATPTVPMADHIQPKTGAGTMQFEQKVHAPAQDLKPIIDAIKANNSLTLIEKVNATLVRIEEQIQKGLVTYSAGNVESTDPNSKFMDKSLRGHWQSAKEGAVGGANKAWEWWKKPGWGTAHWARRDEHLATAKTKLGDLWGSAKKKYQDLSEVWVEGELVPRLSAFGLRSGMYYDSKDKLTRKAISSWKQIKGAVYDAEGNEILSMKDAARAFSRTTVGKKLLDVSQWVKDKAQEAWEGAKSLSGGIYARGYDLAKRGMEYLNAQDVYTKLDLKNPVLQATIMRAKGYRSKATDKIIENPAGIDGAVINLAGDVVLTEDQIKAGLCDMHGRPIVTNHLRLLQLGKDAIHATLNKVQNGFNMAKDFLSGKWQGFANWFKVDGIAFSGGKTIIERLTEIRDLLDLRLPGRKKHVVGDIDGSGIRDNSYQDEERKRKGAGLSDSGTSLGSEPVDDKPGGPPAGASRFGGAAAAFMAMFSKRKDKSASTEGDKGGEKEGIIDKIEHLTDMGVDAKIAFDLVRGGLKLGGRGASRVLRTGLGAARYGTEAYHALKAGEAVKTPLEAYKAAKAVKEAETAARAAGELAPKSSLLRRAATGIGNQAGKVVGKGYRAIQGARVARTAAGLAAAGEGAEGAVDAASTVTKAATATGKVASGLAKAGNIAKEAVDVGSTASLASKLIPKAGIGTAIKATGRFLGRNALKLGTRIASRAIPSAIEAGAGIADFGITAAGMAGEGILAVGSGILSLVGAPVLIGAAALAGVGYLAYKGYKAFMAKKLTNLSTLRYIQYGFAPDDKDHYSAVFKLEDMLEKNVSYKDGIAQLGTKGLSGTDLIDLFDVDKDDKDQVNNFSRWFSARFKPVFLLHMSVLHKVDPSATLAGLEKLKPLAQQTYLNEAKWPGGPYKETTSPFPKGDALTQGPAEVSAYAEAAGKIVAAAVKKDAPNEAKRTAESAAAAAAAGAPKTIAQLQSEALVKKALGLKPDPQRTWQAVDKMPDGKTGTGIMIGGAMLTVAGTFTPSAVSVGARLDAMSVIRFKTYGLRDMNIEKVKTLIHLEDLIQPDVTFDSKYVASWTGDFKKLYAAAAPAFGADVNPTSRTGYNWTAWFQMRFLPTYLNYLSGVGAATKKQDARLAMLALKPDDAISVATAVKTSTGKSGSVWGIAFSPWADYELNSDAKSTDANFAGLQDLATKTKLEETKGDKNSGDKSSDKKKTGETGGEPPSTMSKLWDSISKGSDGKQNWVGKSASAVGGAFSKAFGGSGSSATGVPSAGAASAPDAAGGVGAIGAPTSGSGGKAATLPDPKGDGTWASMKDLITGAAKMVGIDPNMLGIMAAIESGFKSKAKAGTSSAAGLFQFIKGTWSDVLKKYGAKYGLGADTSPFDPKANALMGGEFTKANIAVLQRGLGKMPTPGQVYGAHFLGAGTAVKLFTGKQDANAASILPDQAKANIPIFYNGGKPRTVAEVSQVFDDLVAKRGKQNGIAIGGIQSSGSEALTKSDAGQGTGKSGAATGGASGGSTGNSGLAASGLGKSQSAVAAAVPSATSATPPATTVAGASTPSTGASSTPANASSTPTPPGGGTGNNGLLASGTASTPKAVFDSLGGATKPAVATTAAATPSTPASGNQFNMPDMGPSSAMGTGFSTDAMRSATDLQASRRNQQAATANTAVPGNEHAEASLGVQKDMLVALQTLVKYAAQPPVAAAPAVSTQTASSGNDPSSMQNTVAASKAASSVPSNMKPNLISVQKPTFV